MPKLIIQVDCADVAEAKQLIEQIFSTSKASAKISATYNERIDVIQVPQ